MVRNNYIIAQTIKEFNFILSKIDKKLNFICIPLNYELMLYCEKNNFSFINPGNYIKNNYHKETIIKVLGILKGFNFKLILDHNIKIEILGFMRFRLNSYFFLEKMFSSLNNHKQNKYFFSGWTDEQPKSLDSYHISDIARLFKNKLNIKLLSKVKIKTKKRIQFSLINKEIIDKKYKNILLSNLGYNFFRFILFSKKKI